MMSATYRRTASSFGISPSRYGAKIASAPITESAASASLRFCAPYTAGDSPRISAFAERHVQDDDPVAELVLLDEKRARGKLHSVAYLLLVRIDQSCIKPGGLVIASFQDA